MMPEYVSIHFNPASVFRHVGNKTRALECFKSEGEYSQCFLLCHELSFSQEETRDLAMDLVDILVTLQDYSDAAEVSLEYLNDASMAVSLYCRACDWNKAQLVAARWNISQVVPESLETHSKGMRDGIHESLGTFKSNSSRLQVVRAKKLEKEQARFKCDEGNELLDDIDVMSDTTSMATTRMTRSSTSTSQYSSSAKSAKSRKRMLKKMNSGRKGGIFEQEFLENSVKHAVIHGNGLAGIFQSIIIIRASGEDCTIVDELFHGW